MSTLQGAPQCAVVVINYNSSALLERNLLRVSQENPDLAVYVVDNSTCMVERERIEQLATVYDWTALFPERNLGFGEGSNAGAARSIQDGAKQLLLLNPDAYVDPTSLARLRSVVAESPSTLAGPVIKTPEGKVWSAGVDLLLETGDMRGWGQPMGAPAPRSLPWLSGACLLLSTRLWQRVGGFDADYFLYWEDVDFSARVQEHGGKVLLVTDTVALHDEGATHRAGEGRVKSPVYYYYNIRNRMLFATKHLSGADVERWRRSSMRAAYHILLRGGRRQFLRPHRNIWPALRGLAAGRQVATNHRSALGTSRREAA